ncbi:pentatricopeptide repeat-containing protein At4g02750-like [Selaginella moellendorffii]|uniref:pentatricopeptide repeat-containing protein At4g02750-like n=1 Tax=Selaginella moellendorffii TaxID=88036 RepID=UPI000D1C9BAA|nr:pentatricopeptide repeat-containing protein At4g02750-like [Selaginella moellendorffii]|eukprot:XP_024542436.1 pentatricopeptide repeat-containing protein At4g02750-like [Selaginella moellendorffii]
MITAYAENGFTYEAREIFEQMPQRNLVSWNAMLAAYAQTGYLEESKGIFDAMPERDLISWTSMLVAFTESECMQKAKYCFDQMPEWDLVALTAMLAGYSRSGHLDKAKILFDDMKHNKETNLVSWICVLSGLTENGKLTDAKTIFDSMPEHDLVSSTAMLAAYAEKEHIVEAEGIFQTIPEVDLVSRNAILTAYSENGNLDKAKEIFDTMEERSIVTWTSMISAYSQNGHLELAKYVFDSMQEHNLVSFNAMLTGYSQHGYLKEAWKIFHSMKERDILSWTAMLSAYAQNGHLHMARHLFDSMEERNSVSWDAMLAGYAQNGRPLEVLDIFYLMELNINPDEASFVCVLLACTHLGRTQAGISYFVSLTVDFGLKATKQHYCCIVDLLSRSGRLEEAGELIAYMPFCPDSWEWTCLLGACKNHNNVELGARGKILERVLFRWSSKLELNFDRKESDISGAWYSLGGSIKIISWRSIMFPGTFENTAMPKKEPKAISVMTKKACHIWKVLPTPKGADYLEEIGGEKELEKNPPQIGDSKKIDKEKEYIPFTSPLAVAALLGRLGRRCCLAPCEVAKAGQLSSSSYNLGDPNLSSLDPVLPGFLPRGKCHIFAERATFEGELRQEVPAGKPGDMLE